MEYDNKHFVSKDFAPRRAFMAKWLALLQGASYLALDGNGAVVGKYTFMEIVFVMTISLMKDQNNEDTQAYH